MKNQFTYSTRTGSQIRTYVKVAIWIFILVAAVGVVATVNRYQMVSKVMATPRPLDSNLIPTQTVLATAPITAIEDCPSDPVNWTLSENVTVSTSNLKVLGPQCVYDKLERTAAWVYATTGLGYTRADAATKLGLLLDGLIAYPTNRRLMVLTDFKDEPQPVDVVIAADNAQLAEWSINANGDVGLELSFSGCFSTTMLTGGEANSWGDYPVVCQFFADYRTRYTVSSANGQLYTGKSIKNVRRPMWFGYIGSGSWSWLGTGNDWSFDLAQISTGKSTLNIDSIADQYGMPVQPLPQNWQSAVGQEHIDALLAELNKSQ
jgi:hypothetical protein